MSWQNSTITEITQSFSELGFTKRRKNLAVKELGEGKFLCLSVGSSKINLGPLMVDIYANCYWQEVEKLVAVGFGLKQGFASSFTSARMLNQGYRYTIGSNESKASVISQILEDVTAIPETQLLELCETQAIIAGIEVDISNGIGYAERLVAIEWITHGKDAAAARFGECLTLIQDEFYKSRLSEFWERISVSDVN
ncbi:hypothetical protein MWU53_01235 [Aliiroseovarius sp. S1123]|uniref:hypothetical protein n=1 Tax=unclassified Aliiroseovarius TaxID=2623558 RepID=UPI001FF2BB63|nr:hypothetical protein [Aliiroseovarius sp. S1123]MCK0169672.1 hypothetical protein [Aliiroseovarius sp. S1123]